MKAGLQVKMKEAVMASGSPELGEQTVGLVGFGDIAQATARRLKPFGCKMYYYSLHRRSPEVEADFGVEYLPLEELAAACDKGVIELFDGDWLDQAADEIEGALKVEQA